jgi:hypothetical protein
MVFGFDSSIDIIEQPVERFAPFKTFVQDFPPSVVL